MTERIGKVRYLGNLKAKIEKGASWAIRLKPEGWCFAGLAISVFYTRGRQQHIQPKKKRKKDPTHIVKF